MGAEGMTKQFVRTKATAGFFPDHLGFVIDFENLHSYLVDGRDDAYTLDELMPVEESRYCVFNTYSRRVLLRNQPRLPA